MNQTPLPQQLLQHLSLWAGGVPGPMPLAVLPNPRVCQPGWDGSPALVTGLVDPAGRMLVSVPPGLAVHVGTTSVHQNLRSLPALVGRPEHSIDRVVLRWCVDPAPLAPLGEWVDSDSPRLPSWLTPFGGKSLVVFGSDGSYLAGVGIKRHDRFGHEISVGTEPGARGRGLARRLVAEAARHIRSRGAIATYLHHPANLASSRVAAAAGFADTGWSALVLSEDAAVAA